MAQAKQVSEETARTVGHNFMMKSLHVAFKQDISLDLAYKSTSTATPSPGNSVPVYFYVFNTEKGFVIVSGDDNVMPVLAYSDENKFYPDKMSAVVYKWLTNYKDQIRDVMETSSNIKPSAAVSAEWTAWLNNTPSALAVGKTTAVTPLLKTTWDQLPYYNAMCPYDNSAGKRAVTGCVATAMAQVMKFWNYPSKGSGFHSYNSSSFGTLSADFGSTTYDWTSMPNSINSINTAIATLMYQCGVSVDMNYSVESSGAYVIASTSPVTNCAEYALKSYFGYKTSLSGLARANYSDVTWLTKIESELDAGRPVIYDGFGSGGGHCFVCDGYDSRNYLHFNWGWSGLYNGYFTINALNPGGVGTGGGSGGYNSSQEMIIGIEPADNNNNGGNNNNNNAFDMEMNDYLKLSATTISYGQGFTVSTNILNNSANDFNGDYCAAIFDNNGAFVDYVDSFINQSLPAGYTYQNDIPFTSKGSFSLLPGTYTIGVYYRPKGGNWIALTNKGSYYDYAQLTVKNAGSIEMYAAMNITSGTPLIAGGTVTVNLDLANYGSDFNGTIDLSLYNLDGTPAASIQQYTGASLRTNSHYANGLTFSTNDLNVAPGNYLMALTVLPNGGNWQLVGSSYYQNPIKVLVQKPALKPDKFEQNNTVANASNLLVGYNGNTGYASTDGANCHNGTDLDFYKILLDTSYTYSITTTLNDLNNSGGGNYSLDGIYSYSYDGTSWSDAYDGTISSPINPTNGVLYFEVSPAFAGVTGTYLLEINVNRTPKQSPTGLKEYADAAKIIVYPNPARGMLNVDLAGYSTPLRKINLVNMQGQAVYTDMNPVQKEKLNIPLTGVAAGVYMLQLQAGNEVISRKIIVQ
jgi:hypothetical protein